MHLTVVEPFFNYVRGNVITDQDKIASVLGTHPDWIKLGGKVIEFALAGCGRVRPTRALVQRQLHEAEQKYSARRSNRRLLTLDRKNARATLERRSIFVSPAR